MVTGAYDSPVDFTPQTQIQEAETRLGALSKAAPPTLTAVPLSEFLELKIQAREWVLEDLLQQFALAMIYAWRGIGKTFFALALAYAIATGGRFLKWQAPRSRRVLYIDGEMPAVGMQERLRGIVEAAALTTCFSCRPISTETDCPT